MKESPCPKCIYFQRATIGRREYAKCCNFGIMLNSLASECNSFESKEEPGLDAMQKSAWIVERTKKLGFDQPIVEFVKPRRPNETP